MQNAKKSLRDLYVLDHSLPIPSHKWMKVINDKDKNASDYSTYLARKWRLVRVVKYVNFNKMDKVADFGCGNGLLLDIIANRINWYYGVDFSKEFIDLSRIRQKKNKIKNANFYCMDIITFCNKNLNSYDKGFAMDFSEHIDDNDFVKIFSAIMKSLVKNGKLYIHTPNGAYLIEILKRMGLLKQSMGHVGIRNDKQYLSLLRKIGYKSIKIKYMSHYLKMASSFHFLSYLPLIGKFFKARLFIECTN